MKRKFIWLLVFVAVAFLVVGFIRLLSGEDNWICQDGKWVKHGHPSSSMPLEQCK